MPAASTVPWRRSAALRRPRHRLQV